MIGRAHLRRLISYIPTLEDRVRIGLHIRTAGDLRGVAGRASRLGCETIQLFSGNPRSWTKAPLDENAATQMMEALTAQNIRPVFVHGSYLPNLGSSDESLFSRSASLVADELARTSALRASALVLHLGSTAKEVPRPARHIAEGIRLAYETAGIQPMMLLENSAGAGNTYGSTFEQIRVLLDELADLPVGVALDTAHAHAAGYRLRNLDEWRKTLREFNRWIGIKRLRLIHANDSLSKLGSHVDRHWHIGQGQIGPEGFTAMGRLAELDDLPVILETPGPEDELDRQNIDTMKHLVRDEAEKGVAP